MGLAKTIAYSISLLPEDLRGMFWAHIGLVGGSTKFPGFRDRLYVVLASEGTLNAEGCTGNRNCGRSHPWNAWSIYTKAQSTYEPVWTVSPM